MKMRKVYQQADGQQAVRKANEYIAQVSQKLQTKSFCEGRSNYKGETRKLDCKNFRSESRLVAVDSEKNLNSRI